MQPDRFVPPSERVAREIAEALHSPGRPVLTVLSGPVGVELTAVEAALCRLLTEHPPPFAQVRVVDFAFAGAASGAALLERIPTAAVLRATAGTLLLLKDVHLLPAEGIGSLDALVRQLATTKSACVCTVALPLPAATRAAFQESAARLHRDGLLHHVTLRPLPRTELPSLVTSLLGAVPERRLADRVWRATHGWPALVEAGLRIGQAHDILRVVDRHAYLTGAPAPSRLSEQHELLTAIRRLGATAWAAAKAVSVFQGLGPAATRLVAEALGTAETQARHELELLARTGVLHHARSRDTWTFRQPLVAVALTWALGPYERRRLAQLAVQALWSGAARGTAPHALPDQLVDAGRLVDPARAAADLLAHARALAPADGRRALPWLRAAAGLTADPAARTEILLLHARISAAVDDPGQALESTGTVLRAHAAEIPADELLDVCFVHLRALSGTGRRDELAELADGGTSPAMPFATPLEGLVVRAYALALVGRWRASHELLQRIREDPGGPRVAAAVRQFGSVVDLWLGDRTAFDHDLAELERRIEAGERPSAEVAGHAGALVALSELRQAERLLDATRTVPLGTPARMILTVGAGRFDDAMELARKHIAAGAPDGCDPAQTVMFQLVSTIQLCRGKLSRARELLATARARGPAMPHLLAIPEALYERAHGEYARTEAILRAAVDEAEENGVLAQTDLLWIALADMGVRTHRTEHLPGYLTKLEKVAKCLGTERAEFNRLTLHALVHDDPAAAAEAMRLLRLRDQPLEQAVALERFVRYGLGEPPALLSESYAIFGAMDALMSRSWSRTLMRQCGVQVPGRQTTLAENERLLAVLVAEGLGNKQIATLLQTGEKSVEGRLSRLFQRSGYRSRVELATAILSGHYAQG
ncbi:regulatory protein, luxR family [Amycolatopsis tolypomycina]|uniref:Regulatory protein, luxR family n=1 Tax=Amycolatopsis tolypomycina TaxID=208445 RepID=A0A1H4SYU2_9PSEU|nr:LuxR C-terminal-related transcriptional regulator [Amycolatopsis tolypomycina]SEC49352.1 regulatory protein, luxR family [Amycolatopsis tolypomycina]